MCPSQFDVFKLRGVVDVTSLMALVKDVVNAFLLSPGLLTERVRLFYYSCLGRSLISANGNNLLPRSLWVPFEELRAEKRCNRRCLSEVEKGCRLAGGDCSALDELCVLFSLVVVLLLLMSVSLLLVSASIIFKRLQFSAY